MEQIKKTACLSLQTGIEVQQFFIGGAWLRIFINKYCCLAFLDGSNWGIPLILWFSMVTMVILGRTLHLDRCELIAKFVGLSVPIPRVGICWDGLAD